MSAIGDYIHSTKQGYMDHGITKDGSYIPWGSQRAWRQQSVKTLEVDEKLLEEYAELVKAIAQSQQEKTNLSSVVNDVVNYTMEQFDNAFQSADLNTMQVEIPNNNEKGYVGRVRTRIGKNSAGETTYTITTTMATLLNKINVLEEKIMKVPSNLTKENIKDLKKRVKEIKKLYTEAFQVSKEQLKNWKNNQKILSMTPSGGKQVAALRKEMNRAIELYAAYPAIHTYEGTLFENVLAAVAYVADHAAYESVKDAIEKTNQGEKIITTEFNKNAFADFLQKNISLDNKTKLVLSGEVDYRSKVDVELKWKDQDFRISAKNLTIRGHKGSASLVDGSPLTTMVQNMDTNFVNHYLNLSSIYGLQTSSLAKEVKAEMKKNLAVVALAGLHINNKQAHVNVFAVNDKEGQGIKFISVKNLVEKMETMERSVSVKYQTAGGQQVNINQFNFTKNTDNQQGAAVRITELIKEMHSLKVHASINVSNLLY